MKEPENGSKREPNRELINESKREPNRELKNEPKNGSKMEPENGPINEPKNETWLLCVKYMNIRDVVSLSMTSSYMRALLSPIIWEIYNRPLYVLWGYRPWLLEYNKKYGIEYRFIAGIFTSMESLILAYQNKLIEYFHLYLSIDKYSLCYYDITCVRAGVSFEFPNNFPTNQPTNLPTNITQQNITQQNITQKIMSHVNDCLNDFELINYHIEHEVRDYITSHYNITHYNITHYNIIHYNNLLSNQPSINNDIYLFTYYSSTSDMVCITYSKNIKNIKPTLSLEKQLNWSLMLPENIYRVPLNIL